jgi:hypothetical protein
MIFYGCTGGRMSDLLTSQCTKPIAAEKAALIAKLIFFAMTGFLVIFGIIVYIVSSGTDFSEQDRTLGKTLLYVLVPVTVIDVILSFVFRILANRAHITSSQESAAPAVFSGFIISLALCEGAAFFAGITYMLSGEPAALGLYVFLFLCMFLHFPFKSRFEKVRDALTIDET